MIKIICLLCETHIRYMAGTEGQAGSVKSMCRACAKKGGWPLYTSRRRTSSASSRGSG